MAKKNDILAQPLEEMPTRYKPRRGLLSKEEETEAHREWTRDVLQKMAALLIREEAIDAAGNPNWMLLAVALAVKHERGFKFAKRAGRPPERGTPERRIAQKRLLALVDELQTGRKRPMSDVEMTAVLLSKHKERLPVEFARMSQNSLRIEIGAARRAQATESQQRSLEMLIKPVAKGLFGRQQPGSVPGGGLLDLPQKTARPSKSDKK